MARVNRLMLVVAAVALAACSSTPDKQWYKPTSYTVAEFQRDRDACTTKTGLDEDCMRQRGWVAISADKGKPVPAPELPSRGRY
jgi:hypothetical protein